MPGRSAIGLDIGTSSVRAAQLGFAKGHVTLERFGQVALPDGSVRDGEVVDSDAVAHAVRQLWSHAKFSHKKVVIGVANRKVVVRQVDLPWLPESELRAALPFQVADFIPIPIDQAVLDFHPLEEMTGQGGERILRGLLVAASREMVLSAVEAVTKAGLTATTVDLSSFAVLRSLATTDDLGMGTELEALVDIGARVTNIVVHQGGIPRFVRILLMGGQDVTDAVAERLGLPYSEAEAVKQRLGLSSQGSRTGDDVATARVVETSGSAFVDEVRGSLDYFAAASTTGAISRLVVTGGGARLGGLVDRLAAATRLPVEVGRPIAGLRLGKTGLTPEQIDFVEPMAAVPVGLALGAAS